MKKTIDVNLGGYSLIFDEDAYIELKEYLDDLSSRLSADYAEIISDVESRLAEIFKSKLSAYCQVVNMSMVKEAIGTMGKAEDFGDFTDSKRSGEKSGNYYRPAPKKLYRNTSNSVFGGVCSGLAEYFNTDVTLIRIIALLLIISGVSIFVYLIMWIIIPAKPIEFNSYNRKI